MIQAMIFDFDDTLVYTNIIFERVKNKFYEKMAVLGLYDEQLPALLNRLDIENVRLWGGLVKDCFPQAMKEAYRQYCGKYQQEYQMQQGEEFALWGYDIFAEKCNLLPYAEDILQKLSKDYPLYLLTQGDHEIQSQRVERSGLLPYFQKVYIVKSKNEADFNNISGENDFLTNQCLSIGNSLRTDIWPALLLGMQAVHINTDCWDYESHQDIKAKIDHQYADNYYPADNLRQCWHIIKKKFINNKK